MMARITIFHTSDMHNKLTAELADRLRDLKEKDPGSLMLDSGDAIWAGNVFWRPGGEPVLKLMNSVPYDAMCVGNREFHFLAVGMRSKTCRADFPLLSANLRTAKRGRKLPTKPYEVFDRGGIRIGVFGLSVPCITERMLVKKVSDYYFDPPVPTAARILPELSGKCDIVIALTHIGVKQDRELAQKARGIDLILGGHTHETTAQPEDTRIVHHGSSAHYVGKVQIDVHSGKAAVTNELIPLAKA